MGKISQGKGEGTLTFSLNQDKTPKILNGRFEQDFEFAYRNTSTKKNTLKGLLDLEGSRLSFEGSYQAYLRNWHPKGLTLAPLQGKVLVRSQGTHSRSFAAWDKVFLNENALNDGFLSALGTPERNPLPDSSLVGSWSGVIDSTQENCRGTGGLLIQQSASWFGKVGSQPIYGVNIAIVNTEQFIFFNDSLQWGVGTLNGAGTEITGTWSRTPCSGDFIFTKQ